MRKLLSEDPGRYDDAATQGVREISASMNVRRCRPASSTRSGWARRSPPTPCWSAAASRRSWSITRGFGDALRIGYQDRPDIFALDIRLPEPLYQSVLEVDERMGADGTLVRPLDEAAARRGLRTARRAGLTSVAIALLHGYATPEHERRLAALARDEGFSQVSASHEVSPLVKLVSRGETAVVDAYLSPILRRYVDRVASRALPGVRTRFMQSHGGLTDARLFRGKDAILSGPAGGIVGAVRDLPPGRVQRARSPSTWAAPPPTSSHFAGRVRAQLRERPWPASGCARRCSASTRSPPAAARSAPSSEAATAWGPAVGRRRPRPGLLRPRRALTVTDCNVLLGKLRPAFFPARVRPARRRSRSTVEAARAALAAVAAAMREAGPGAAVAASSSPTTSSAWPCDTWRAPSGEISTQRGYDITGYTLCCFGGAAGQHACLVADASACARVLIHPLAGVLSAPTAWAWPTCAPCASAPSSCRSRPSLTRTGAPHDRRRSLEELAAAARPSSRPRVSPAARIAVERRRPHQVRRAPTSP